MYEDRDGVELNEGDRVHHYFRYASHPKEGEDWYGTIETNGFSIADHNYSDYQTGTSVKIGDIIVYVTPETDGGTHRCELRHLTKVNPINAAQFNRFMYANVDIQGDHVRLQSEDGTWERMDPRELLNLGWHADEDDPVACKMEDDIRNLIHPK